MTRNVYYWQGCVNQAEFEAYAEEIGKLLSGDAPIEKLKNHNIYSARFSLKGRILFTFLPVQEKQCLLLLEILPDHEYASARFLKKNILKNYLEKNIDRLTNSAVFESVDNATLPEFKTRDVINYVTAHYYNQQFITLDGKQQDALTAPTPVIISGPAGSGKSCILFGVLQKLVEMYPVDETKDILFVAESPELAKHMMQMWSELEEIGINHQRVKFLSYDAMLNELNSTPLSELMKAGKSDFQNWFKGYKRRDFKNSSQSGIWDDVSAIYQELRVISAYTKKNGYFSRANYIDSVGKKQSLFLDQKAQLVVIYEDYMTYLAKGGQWDPAFHELDVRAKYYGIVVDEALDLSVGQWTTLLDLAQNHQIYYASDSHQMINDRKSHRPLLLSLLRTITGQNVSHVELNGSYRCPNAVITLVNAVISIKNQLTQGMADQYELSDIALSNDPQKENGGVYWHDPSKEEDRELKAVASSLDCAVITLSKHKREAQLRYNTPLVFTPLEAKGLGYRDVIAYKLLDSTDEDLDKANKLLGPVTDTARKYVNQSKHEQGDRRFAPVFNDIIVAFTRTTQRLFFVQEHSHKLRHILAHLAKGLEVTKQSEIDVNVRVAEVDSPEKWFEHALMLLRHGNAVQAEDVLNQKCFMTAEQIAETKTKYLVNKNGSHEKNAANRFELLKKMKFLYKNCTVHNLQACYREGDVSWLAHTIPNQTISYFEWLSRDSIRTEIFHQFLKTLKTDNNFKDLMNKLVCDMNWVHLAAGTNNLTFISFIKNMGLSINSVDANGKAPLYFAIKEGRLDVIRALYELGVDIDNPVQNYVPMHVAIEFNQLGVVCLLINLGIPKTINCCNADGKTPLMVAHELNYPLIIVALTKAVAPPEQAIGNLLPPLALPPAAQPLPIKKSMDINTFLESLLTKFNSVNVASWLKMKSGTSYLYRDITETGCPPAPLLECILDDPERKQVFCDYLKNCEPSHKKALLYDIHSKVCIKTGSDAVHFAALFDCEALIKLFVEQGLSLVRANYKRERPLYIALVQGHVNVANLLLPAYSNPVITVIDDSSNLPTGLNIPYFSALDYTCEEVINGLNSYRRSNPYAIWNAVSYLKGSTPLFDAVHHNNLVTASSLLQQETFDVNAVAGENNVTLLSIAAQWRYSDMVCVLLAHGADPDQALKDGTTPLLIAAQRNDAGICRRLLESGASPSQCANNGCSPLLAAVNLGHVEVVELLFKVNSLMLLCELKVNGITTKLLARGILNHYPWLVDLMKTEFANLKAAETLYKELNAPRGNINNCKDLFSNDKTLDFLLTKSNFCPYGLLFLLLQDLTYAGRFCDFLRADIKANANTLSTSIVVKMYDQMRSWNGENMVHIAALANSVLFINLLHEINIEFNLQIDVDRVSNQGLSPIFYALEKGYVDAMSALINAGARAVNSVDILYTAIDEEQPAVIELLGRHATAETINSAARGDTPLTFATKTNNEVLVLALIKSNAAIDLNLPREKDGSTALHIATMAGNLRMVNLFLSYSTLDVDLARDSDGITPLMLAVMEGNLGIIRALTRAGASITKLDSNGLSATMIAAAMGRNDIFEKMNNKLSLFATQKVVERCKHVGMNVQNKTNG